MPHITTNITPFFQVTGSPALTPVRAGTEDEAKFGIEPLMAAGTPPFDSPGTYIVSQPAYSLVGVTVNVYTTDFKSSVTLSFASMHALDSTTLLLYYSTTLLLYYSITLLLYYSTTLL